MILEFLSDASAELFEAAAYYESKQEGLGRRFRNEVLEVCGMIVQQPFLWRERAGGYRRVNCPVFPYYIAYFIRGDLIVVAAMLTATGVRGIGNKDCRQNETEPAACSGPRECVLFAFSAPVARGR